MIERAVAGEAAWAACFIKLVLTAITIGVGYKGGEIVPVLFIGATFGAAYGGFFGLAPSFAAGLGMVGRVLRRDQLAADLDPAGL